MNKETTTTVNHLPINRGRMKLLVLGNQSWGRGRGLEYHKQYNIIYERSPVNFGNFNFDFFLTIFGFSKVKFLFGPKMLIFRCPKNLGKNSKTIFSTNCRRFCCPKKCYKRLLDSQKTIRGLPWNQETQKMKTDIMTKSISHLQSSSRDENRDSMAALNCQWPHYLIQKTEKIYFL